MSRLANKVAIVTGASRGIGKGIACGLASEGAKVVIAARSQEGLRKTAQRIQSLGGVVLEVPTDVTEEAQIIGLFKRTIEAYGQLDILINNAGLVEGGALDQLSAEAWDKVLATNLRGPFLCTREAMRIMKTQGSGRIINIGSISAQRPRPNAAAYSASKFGIWGLTLSTALEGREHGITASCLHPGNVKVEIPGSPEITPPTEPFMEVENIVEAAVLMASLPAHVNMLEAIVLPTKQAYLGRG